MMSESHQRQLLLFAETPGKFVSSFSKFVCHYLFLIMMSYKISINI